MRMGHLCVVFTCRANNLKGEDSKTSVVNVIGRKSLRIIVIFPFHFVLVSIRVVIDMNISANQLYRWVFYLYYILHSPFDNFRSSKCFHHLCRYILFFNMKIL